MLRIVEGMYPRTTGWSYVDPPTGTELKDGSLSGLIRRVADWRARNGFPVGTPESDVHEYLCRHNPPSLCRGAGPEPAPAPKRALRLSVRVMAWLTRMAGARSTPVPSAVRAERAAICAACPRNQTYAVGCRGCNASSLKVREALIAGAPEYVRGLGGCEFYGWDNAVAVGLPHTVDRGAPSDCWRSR